MIPAQQYQICLLFSSSSLRERKCCLCGNGTSAERRDPTVPLHPALHSRVVEYRATQVQVHHLELCHLMGLQFPLPCDLGPREARRGPVRNGLDFHLGLPKPKAYSFLFLSSFLFFPAPMHRNWHGHRCPTVSCVFSINAFKIISGSLGCNWNMSR